MLLSKTLLTKPASLLLMVVIPIFVYGCAATPRLTEWQTDFWIDGFNFAPYTEKGFMFTPESYSGEYESIGIVEIFLFHALEEGNVYLFEIHQDHRVIEL